MVASREWPDLEFIACRWGHDGRAVAGQPTKIVVHATDNTASARNEAAYAARRSDYVSAHYFVDGLVVIQGTYTWDTAWTALQHGNEDGIQYELCGRSGGTWADGLLRRAAAQMARDMRKYRIRNVRLVGREVRVRAATGVAGHVDFTVGWPEDGGTHTDPGANFPWATLLSMIADELNGEGYMTDETNTTEETIWELLDKGTRATGSETAQFPKPGGGTWSRPLNWLVRRLLELEEAITAERTEPVPVTLSDEQLAALSENVTDQVVARLQGLRFVAEEGS